MPYHESDCLDNAGDRGPCAGVIARRPSCTGATTSVRCARHDEAYRARTLPALEAINLRYPDTDVPPPWFDPTYAGESWNPID